MPQPSASLGSLGTSTVVQPHLHVRSSQEGPRESESKRPKGQAKRANLVISEF